MTISIDAFRRLQKSMALTASAVDAEALAALRAANKILADNKLTWADVFGRLVTVDVEQAAPEDMTDLKVQVNDAFEVLSKTDMKGNFESFIGSLKDQWDRTGWLSKAQREALFRAAEKAQ
jgi:hypothetical protein